MLFNWAWELVEPACIFATHHARFKMLWMFSFRTFCRIGDGYRKTLFGAFCDAQEPVYELSHTHKRTHAPTHTHSHRHVCSFFLELKALCWTHTLTLCLWLLQGSLPSSWARLSGIPNRHWGRAFPTWDSSPYRLCFRIWGLDSGCHGNHVALTPRRRGTTWSPQETTAAAKTWNRKSVACRWAQEVWCQIPSEVSRSRFSTCTLVFIDYSWTSWKC